MIELLKLPVDSSSWPRYLHLNFNRIRDAILDLESRTERNQNWVDITSFTGGWSSYGSGNAPVGYTLEDDKWISLRGVLTGGAAGSAAFTLPVEFDYTYVFPVVSGGAFGTININTSGDVTPATVPNPTIRLDSIRLPYI